MSRVLFIFSFDDSSRYVQLCARLLEKFGFRGTFYLDIRGLNKIGIRCVRDLYLSGHEIGSHTVTHRDLSKLPLGEVRWELLKSKEILEKIIDNKIKSLAYPFGKFNSRTVELVREIGYDNARTVEPYLVYGMHAQNRYTLGITFYIDPHAIRSLIKAVLRLRYPTLLHKPLLLKNYYMLIVSFLKYIVDRLQIRNPIGIHILCHPDFLAQRDEFSLFAKLLEALQSYSNKSLTVSEAVKVFRIA